MSRVGRKKSKAQHFLSDLLFYTPGRFDLEELYFCTAGWQLKFASGTLGELPGMHTLGR